jgi:hypothetical protein
MLLGAADSENRRPRRFDRVHPNRTDEMAADSQLIQLR